MKKVGAELRMYRVYGYQGNAGIDEYCEAKSAQDAVDRVREWFADTDEPPVEILEVARVVHNWK